MKWYLDRQADKGDSFQIPDRAEQQIQAMWDRHPGKMREWFDQNTRWYIAELDAVEDVSNLVFLESSWTKAAGLVIPGGLNYRLLHRVARNALACHYLSTLPANHQEHRKYYDLLLRGELQLSGINRVAICTAEQTEVEWNPDAHYYLLDGVGRSLPYMMLLLEQKAEHVPIEAFVAQRATHETGPSSS